jgi:MerR family transcriptional regulator/heat shock protein HspR
MKHIIFYNNFRVEIDKEQGMGQSSGVYVIRVASMLTGMHPQTLRKYERAGLLEPSRCKKLRMYSDEDIVRLRVIKHFVDDIGLNLAGIRIALMLQDTVLKIRNHMSSAEISNNRRKQMLKSLDESLRMLGVASGLDNNLATVRGNRKGDR